jgi:VCBS repeat protein
VGSALAVDINGDGKLDLITAGTDPFSEQPEMSVHLGLGNGKFQTLTAVTLNQRAGAMTLGDFNRDGKLDLAIPDYDLFSGSVVDVLLGNGDGTFQTFVEYPVSFGVQTSVAAADLNGDGKLDLITDGVAVLLGNGDGTFTDDGGVTVTKQGGNGSQSVCVGDFDGDGKADVALVFSQSNGINNVQSLALLLGNGDGTLQSALEFPAGNEFFLGVGFGVGDFNQDGKLDVALVQADTNTGLPLLSFFYQQ